MSGAGAWVAGVGASTPIGFDARQTALFLRAKKVVPRRTSFEGRLGPIGTVRARRLDELLVGPERWSALAAPALREALSGYLLRCSAAFIALPPSRPGEPTGEAWMTELARGEHVVMDQPPQVVRIGHAGFAVALAQGLDHLARAPGADVIVGGVDSHHDPERLAELDVARRLHGFGAVDGFIPSEGAAFLRLSVRAPERPFAQVAGVAAGAERPEEPDQPWIGEVATALFRTVMEAQARGPAWLLSDVNGERDRVQEWDRVRIRNRDLIADDSVEHRPCDELGDVGSASGAVFAAIAGWAFRLGYAPHATAVVTLASDGAERGVFALRAPPLLGAEDGP